MGARERPRPVLPIAVCPFCGCAHLASLCPFCRWTASEATPAMMVAPKALIEELEHFKDRIETYLLCLRSLRLDGPAGGPH